MKTLLLILSSAALLAQSKDTYPRTLAGYTAAQLGSLAPAARGFAAQTDSLSSTCSGAITGGGSTNCIVIYSGSAWSYAGGVGGVASLTAGLDGMLIVDCVTGVCTVGGDPAFIASITPIRSIGVSKGDPAGSALATGVLGYFTATNDCEITGWDIVVNAGTATVDIWKIATGTAIPTDANTITASAVPAISTGTVRASTTLTGWTVAVLAGDVFGFNLDAVATASYIKVAVRCQ